LTSQKIEQLISAYASNLEVLVAWDKAIQDSRLSEGDRTVAFPEIVKRLEAPRISCSQGRASALKIPRRIISFWTRHFLSSRR